MIPPGNKIPLGAPTPVAEGGSRANGWVEIPTSPYLPANPDQRWLIQMDDGDLQLVETERDLAELLRLGRVTGRTPVYAVADGPRALGEIPEMARLMSKSALSEEPPVRREHRSPDRTKLSEELAVLNRPLDDEIEYYDEMPTRRWPKRVAFAVAFVALMVAAYPFVVPRLPAWRSLVLTGLLHSTRWSNPVADSGPPPGTRPPTPSGSTGAEITVPLATATVDPVQAPPPVGEPQAPPQAARGSADGAPVAARATGAETHKRSHSTRRHATRKRSTSKR